MTVQNDKDAIASSAKGMTPERAGSSDSVDPLAGLGVQKKGKSKAEAGSARIGSMNIGMVGNRGEGKAIDQWTFQTPFRTSDKVGPEAMVPRTYTVDVLMRKRSVKNDLGAINEYGRQVIEFVAKCPALPDGHMVSSDIEALRASVDAHLREQSILTSGVIWEDWLEVIVTGGHGYSFGAREVVGSGVLTISYSKLRRGRHEDLPGQDYTIGRNGTALPFPKPKKVDEAEVRSGKWPEGEGFRDSAWTAARRRLNTRTSRTRQKTARPWTTSSRP